MRPDADRKVSLSYHAEPKMDYTNEKTKNKNRYGSDKMVPYDNLWFRSWNVLVNSGWTDHISADDSEQ